MGERICPYCGAHLDPDERCDCRDEKGPACGESSTGPDNKYAMCPL